MRVSREETNEANKKFPMSNNRIDRAKARPIYMEAVKRLRILVEPKLVDGKTLPIAEAPAECKSLIALSTLVEIVRSLQSFAIPREPLTKDIELRAKQTFKMFQDGDKITYQFIDGGFTGSSSFPVPKP